MRRVVLGLVLASSVAACGSQVQPTASSVAVIATPPPSSGAAPEPTASPTTAATAAPTPKPTPEPAPSPTPNPTPVRTPACLASDFAAKVTLWEGATGHQIASVTLTNASAARCALQGTPEVELVDAHGRILIDSQTDGPAGLPHVAPGDPVLALKPGGSATTLVDADNYCGAKPALPTTVAFVFPNEAGRVVAARGPGGAVPPCLRSPGSLGSIAMNGWVKA